jgi:flagellar biosynthesis protein FlhG
LEDEADIILIDTSAGMTKNVIKFALLADDIILVTTPEPSAITDAYAMIKVIHGEEPEANVGLIMNLARSEHHAMEVARKIAEVSKHFLNFNISVLGTLPNDPYVPRAVMQRQPWTELYPKTGATRSINRIAAKVLNGDTEAAQKGSGLIQRISAYFRPDAPMSNSHPI